jgi:phage shock protein PspC (stress-responsive transcriptional regulator)
MNKVTTINLGGRAYQLEEPGYDKLRAYLDDATAKLGSDPDAQEVVLDLERAIAEKCDTYLVRGKTVVSASEVDQIIADMGPVHTDTENDSKTSSTTADSARRLYRVRGDAVLFGICSGLAVYLDVNVVLIRIIFIVLAIATHGAMFIAYLIAALFIPRADTPEKRAAAHGVPFSTQDFIARAHALGDEAKANGKEWKRYSKSMKREYHAQRFAYDHSNDGWAWLGPIFGLLSLVWVFALLSVISTHAIFGWALPATMPLWEIIVIMAVLYSLFLSPLRYIQHGKSWHHGPVTGPLRFILEILVIWFVGWFLYNHVATIHDFFNMVGMQLQQIPWLR